MNGKHWPLIGVVFGLAMAVVVIALVVLSRDTGRSATTLAPGCTIADQAHLDYHPLSPKYVGALIAQQLKNDGVPDDSVPTGYELEHAAHLVARECLP